MLLSEVLVLLLFFNCLVPQTASAARSEMFRCGNTSCKPGQDCINSRCADPCESENHTPLRDSWRSTKYKIQRPLHCDTRVNWQGWYRMYLGDYSVQMPESCVEKNRCGTDAPLWLTAPHPLLADGVQKRKVCGHWSSNCCAFKSNPIHVKACPGNYYVYKFVKPINCHLAYCADANKVCANCKGNEVCVSDDKITRCEKIKLTPGLVCGRSIMQVGLQLAQFKPNGLDSNSAHLVDHRCSTHQERNKTVWYRVQRTAGSCGTMLTTNSSHAIYSNILFVYPVQSLSNVTLVQPHRIPFSCSYPLDMETSLDVAIKPVMSSSKSRVGGLSGSGPKASVSMSLFHNASYTKPYPSGRVSLPLGSVMYVGVSVEEMEEKRFVVVLENCYATHSSNPEDRERYSLIQRKCPSVRGQVVMTESGSSLKARFSALLFLFQGDYREVFLHCSLSLCDKKTSSCRPNCSGRRRRSVSESLLLKPLMIGPITWGQHLE